MPTISSHSLELASTTKQYFWLKCAGMCEIYWYCAFQNTSAPLPTPAYLRVILNEDFTIYVFEKHGEKPNTNVKLSLCIRFISERGLRGIPREVHTFQRWIFNKLVQNIVRTYSPTICAVDDHRLISYLTFDYLEYDYITNVSTVRKLSSFWVAILIWWAQ